MSSNAKSKKATDAEMDDLLQVAEDSSKTFEDRIIEIKKYLALYRLAIKRASHDEKKFARINKAVFAQSDLQKIIEYTEYLLEYLGIQKDEPIMDDLELEGAMQHLVLLHELGIIDTLKRIPAFKNNNTRLAEMIGLIQNGITNDTKRIDNIRRHLGQLGNNKSRDPLLNENAVTDADAILVKFMIKKPG